MQQQNARHFDVVIVGAGVSGIGAACHLRRGCPSKTFAILEAREAIGGTWDLFRYPGIRSDSDMHTFGYNFKPWRAAKAIADGPSIRAYVQEAADEHAVMPHVRFRHRVLSAAWSSESALWTLEVEHGDEPLAFTCRFLFMCSGYFSYRQGYLPELAGLERFAGPVIHPQAWPEDLDYAGKRIAVIGSGATAMTLVPALAQRAAKVTMIQRSPTYVVSRPSEDAIANALGRWLPEGLAYALTRWKNVRFQQWFYRRTRVAPEAVKAKLLDLARKHLGDLGADYVEKHFTPSYNPWDQRLCLIPDADLFAAILAGKAEVATEHIATITPDGVRLESGQEVKADVLITATGLNLALLGGVAFRVDGEPVEFPNTVTYKGIMFSDVPNMANVFGYVNASWTLRADITCEYVCRLLNRMDQLHMRQCTARLGEAEKDMPRLPWIVGFTPGYLARSLHLFPKQGDRDPWRNTQNYPLDRKMARRGPLEDGALAFSNPEPVRESQAPPAVRNAA